MFESVTIELKLTNNRRVVIACVHIAPGSDVTLFCDTIERLFNQTAIKKAIFSCGDFNIDLLKHDSHGGTKYFVDLMFSLGIYPIITNPTTNSNVFAPLIDNIFTNDIDGDITSGLFVTDISDHLPVFAICKYDGNRRSCPAKYQRQTSTDDANALETALNAHSWDTVLSHTYINEAYSGFHSDNAMYNKHCSLRRVINNNTIEQKPLAQERSQKCM